MKSIYFLLLFLLSAGVVAAQSPTIIDLCSGREDNGMLMSDASIPDPDWTYTDPSGVISIPVTRYAATALGWSSASTGGIAGISRWITGGSAVTGYHFYESKEFVVPAGATNATVNLRSLSFVRNWTFLVKKNPDSTETETQITATSWLSDGAKGWLNSRSPEVVNYPVPAGRYIIRVKAYTNNGSQRQAIDVNANVQYTVGTCIKPTTPTISNIVQPGCANPSGSFTITNYSAANTYAINPATGVTQSGSTITAPVGSYTVTATTGGCTSDTSAGVVISAPQAATQAIIDLRTGIDNTTGQQIVNSQIDPDWTEYDANGNLIGNVFARVIATPTGYPLAGSTVWPCPQIITGDCENAKWVEMANYPTGTAVFMSRKFTVPTSGTFSMRALSAGVNNARLIQWYNDGSYKETFLAKTTGTSVNNSGNALYVSSIPAGTYQIKIIVDPYNGTVSRKINVNARVNYGACANPVKPVFAAVPDIMPGDPAPVLPTTSLNGVSGTWAPAAVSNTTSGIYTFYPNTGCCATSTTVNLAVKDWTKAPNSYIFDVHDTLHNGLYIPVKKAYAMWKDTGKDFGLKNPIAGGAVSATVYWEDVSGLIKTPDSTSFNLNMIGSGESAKIEVPIDKTKGKGNAVIALKVDGEVKWSWHIWVTDNPENGSQFRQGYETGLDNTPFSQIPNYTFKWMDRNLGATNASFLGNDWNKSSGMMYQWGRKDPIPPLNHKDGTGYEITGDAAISRAGKSFSPVDRTYNQPRPFTNYADPGNPAYGWLLRPFDSAAANIKYAVQHPLTLLLYTEWRNQNFATWFSKQEYKVPNTAAAGQNPNSVSWDLWSDNNKGKPSNYSTSDLEAAKEAKSYELKSAYDPCPCNWRIPSHYGSLLGGTGVNAASPWGRKNSGGNDDKFNAWDATAGFFLSPAVNGGKPSSQFVPGVTNNFLPDTKAYVGLGYDFTNQENRNLGMLPITGAYVFTGPNQEGDMYNPSPKMDFMNNTSVGGLPTATYGPYHGTNGLMFRAEPYKMPDSNFFFFGINQTGQTNGAAPVRCMADPNSAFIGDFSTEYIPAATPGNSLADYATWAKDPNSYIVMTNTTTDTITEQQINLRKAYAMQRLYLSANNQPPSGTPSVDVVWTSNPNLISSLSIAGTGEAASNMVVKLKTGQTGNAVVALRIGNTGTTADPIIWSWHIWAPETDPTTSTITYTTEKTVPSAGTNVVNPTKNSAIAPLATTIMDRNLGALIAFPNTAAVTPLEAQKSIGLHYQWGRKDPLPTFQDQPLIYKGTGASSVSVNSTQYNSDISNGGAVSSLSAYGSSSALNIIGDTVDKKHEKIRRVLSYAAQNPLTYLYNDVNNVDWVSDKAGLEAERWGHATEKSPFDPCPAGWRIPDMSYAFAYSTNWVVGDGTKGTSPWYLGDIIDPAKPSRWGVNQMAYTATSVYKGTQLGDLGFQFKDSTYVIGNYPYAGIRGAVNAGVSTTYSGSGGRLGIWTAAQTNDMGGSAFALSIRLSEMATSLPFAPHQAMSCRCAQIKYDGAGNEIGRYDPNAIPVSHGAVQKPGKTFNPQEVKGLVTENKLILFPNPVKDILRINATDTKDYYYQIYNMAGQLVTQGKFNNHQTDVSTLLPGTYLIRINNAESVVKIIKQ